MSGGLMKWFMAVLFFAAITFSYLNCGNNGGGGVSVLAPSPYVNCGQVPTCAAACAQLHPLCSTTGNAIPNPQTCAQLQSALESCLGGPSQ